MSRYFRHPRTTQERKMAYGGWNRAKRSRCNLPTNYDDIPIRHYKSWKYYRKTQYKVKLLDQVVQVDGFLCHQNIESMDQTWKVA